MLLFISCIRFVIRRVLKGICADIPVDCNDLKQEKLRGVSLQNHRASEKVQLNAV